MGSLPEDTNSSHSLPAIWKNLCLPAPDSDDYPTLVPKENWASFAKDNLRYPKKMDLLLVKKYRA